MTDATDLTRFSFAAFESLDVVRDEEAAQVLRIDLERVVMKRLNTEGLDGVEGLISELNALGHRFERQQRDDGWATWLEHTNEGDRHFYVHVESDEDGTVMVLYDETLDAMVARRRAAMSASERQEDERISRFYDRGLELVRLDPDDLTPEERAHLGLYLLETGVQNGGFHTHIGNTGGQGLEATHGALVRLGAADLAEIVAEVIELLPPPGERTDGAVLDALQRHRGRLNALDERFYQSADSIPHLAIKTLGTEADGP